MQECMFMNIYLLNQDSISSVTSVRMKVYLLRMDFNTLNVNLMGLDFVSSVTSERMHVHEYLPPEPGFYQFCNICENVFHVYLPPEIGPLSIM